MAAAPCPARSQSSATAAVLQAKQAVRTHCRRRPQSNFRPLCSCSKVMPTVAYTSTPRVTPTTEASPTAPGRECTISQVANEDASNRRWRGVPLPQWVTLANTPTQKASATVPGRVCKRSHATDEAASDRRQRVVPLLQWVTLATTAIMPPAPTEGPLAMPRWPPGNSHTAEVQVTDAAARYHLLQRILRCRQREAPLPQRHIPAHSSSRRAPRWRRLPRAWAVRGGE